MSALLPLAGRARRLGDDVRADHILAPRHGEPSVDMAERCSYLFEALDPDFAASLRDGDILVAGRNFGAGPDTDCGIDALRCVGIRAVVAAGFARGFLRSAFNHGLLAVTAPTGQIADGETIRLNDAVGGEGVELHTAQRLVACDPLPPFARSLLEAGGLVPYLRAYGSFGPALPGERF